MTGIIKTDQIQGAGSSTVTIPSGTALNVTTVSGTPTFNGDVTLPSINGGQIGGRRNIVVNGAMQVAQRGTSATGKGNNDEGYDTVDRFRLDFAGSTAGRLTMTQETITDLPGFANAIKLACTTADTSIASDEMGRLSTRFEGQDLQQFKKGTSEAESITISFYVKGNANATYALDLFDDDNTRQASQLFSVTSSWTRVVKTFAPDTTGAFDDDNARSLQMNIFFHAGSNLTSGTLNQTFASNTNANRAVGISSFFDSTDRTFFITGLQMEVGSQATPFEHRSFGEELNLCQRYFEKWEGADGSRGVSSYALGGGVWYSNDQILANLQYTVTKRVSPTITVSGAAALKAYGNGYARAANDTTCFDQIEEKNARINISPFTGSGTAGYGTLVQINSGQSISIDAEL